MHACGSRHASSSGMMSVPGAVHMELPDITSGAMATSAAQATPLAGADEQLELAPRSFDDIHRAALGTISVRVGPAATEAKVQLAQNARGGIPGVVYDCSLVMAHLLRTSPAWAGIVARRGSRVLELGCGCGLVGISVALALAEAGGGKVTLTDVHPAALELARQNAELNGVGESCKRVDVDIVRYGLGDTEAGGIAAGGFDVVLASDVIYCDENIPLLVASLLFLLVAPCHGGNGAGYDADGDDNVRVRGSTVALVGFKKRNARRERLLLQQLGAADQLEVEAIESGELPVALQERGLTNMHFGLLRVRAATPCPVLMLTNAPHVVSEHLNNENALT